MTVNPALMENSASLTAHIAVWPKPNPGPNLHPDPNPNPNPTLDTCDAGEYVKDGEMCQSCEIGKYASSAQEDECAVNEKYAVALCDQCDQHPYKHD